MNQYNIFWNMASIFNESIQSEQVAQASYMSEMQEQQVEYANEQNVWSGDSYQLGAAGTAKPEGMNKANTGKVILGCILLVLTVVAVIGITVATEGAAAPLDEAVAKEAVKVTEKVVKASTKAVKAAKIVGTAAGGTMISASAIGGGVIGSQTKTVDQGAYSLAQALTQQDQTILSQIQGKIDQVMQVSMDSSQQDEQTEEGMFQSEMQSFDECLQAMQA